MKAWDYARTIFESGKLRNSYIKAEKDTTKTYFLIFRNGVNLCRLWTGVNLSLLWTGVNLSRLWTGVNLSRLGTGVNLSRL